MRPRGRGDGGVPMLLFKLGMWFFPVRARRPDLNRESDVVEAQLLATWQSSIISSATRSILPLTTGRLVAPFTVSLNSFMTNETLLLQLFVTEKVDVSTCPRDSVYTLDPRHRGPACDQRYPDAFEWPAQGDTSCLG